MRWLFAFIPLPVLAICFAAWYDYQNVEKYQYTYGVDQQGDSPQQPPIEHRNVQPLETETGSKKQHQNDDGLASGTSNLLPEIASSAQTQPSRTAKGATNDRQTQTNVVHAEIDVDHTFDPIIEDSVAAGPENQAIDPRELGIFPDPNADRMAKKEATHAALEPASIEEELPNGERLTIADFDADRLASMTPRRNVRHNERFSGQGSVSKDDERLRFDSDDDYFSIFDNLKLGKHKHVDLSFELEFDKNSTAQRSDLTVFWGARPGDEHRNAWSGYEVKLGGPGLNHIAYKYGGRDIIPRGTQPEAFEAGRKYQIDIEQRDGHITVMIDGKSVFTGQGKAPTGERAGFGFLIYQASGWVGPCSDF